MNSRLCPVILAWIVSITMFSCSSNTNIDGTEIDEPSEYFDEVCNIFTEASALNASYDEMSAYIEENVASRIAPGNALDAYNGMFYLEPLERYPLFKKTAQHSLNSEWECTPMMELLQQKRID